MDFGILVSIISAAVATVIGGMTKAKSDSYIVKYFNITLKLIPLVIEAEFKLPPNINKHQIAKSTSVVGLYYMMKKRTITLSMFAISIGSIVLFAINKYYYINGINDYFSIAFTYIMVLLFYFAVLTYRVQSGHFGTTDSDVRELLTFVYKNADCINDNNSNGGGKKLKVFYDAPESKMIDVPQGHEDGVRI